MGGGRIAARKLTGLLNAGATITVIAPTIDAAIKQRAIDDPTTVELVQRAYQPNDVAGFRLVITATGDPTIDGAVAADADAAGIWVNSADDPANCTFVLPAVHREGPVSIAVSSGGASPALASWLRDQIAASFGGDLATLAEVLAEARDAVKASGRSTETIDWRTLLDGPFPELMRDGNLADANVLLNRTIG